MVKIGHAPKTVALEDGTFLHFWYANNKGRGRDNCTIILSSQAERAAKSADQIGLIRITTTSSWAGNVNFSEAVRKRLIRS